MVNGQRLQDGAALPVNIVRGEESITLQHVGNQIAVGEHCTLGDAGGATRVLQHGEILSVENHGAIGCFGTLAKHIVEF